MRKCVLFTALLVCACGQEGEVDSTETLPAENPGGLGEMNFPELQPAEIPGAPRLGEPFLVMAGDQPVLTEKHGLAAPALWDWDGDGRRDLLVGEFETYTEDYPMGAAGSTIRVYRNVGTDAAPEFSSEFDWARDTEGTIMEVSQWCCIGFTPQFFDLDADGHKDMITGQYHPGEVTWFRGSAEGFLPGEKLPQEGDPSANGNAMFGYVGDEIGSFDYWVYTSATFGDLDDDGDYDLIVGGSAGLRMSENIGGPENPSFARRKLLLDIHGQPLQTRVLTAGELQALESMAEIAAEAAEGALIKPPPAGDIKSNPTAADWDQDGVLDLLVTDSYTRPNSRAVSFFRGVKTPDGHRFEPGVDLLPARDGAKALPGSGARVYVDDWNLDGVNDLIIGASVATVNGGEFSNELSWEWESVNEVESAGKDPERYPPRERPTVESLRQMYTELAAEKRAEGREITVLSDAELEEQVVWQQQFWDKEIGRLYEEGKEHWLTMRHQGRVYVMLGEAPQPDAPALADESSEGSADAGEAAFASVDRAARADSAALAEWAESGANDASASSPVSIRVTSPVVLRRGSAAEIGVQLDMQDGWYVYAPTVRNEGQGMKETQVHVEFPDGLRSAGAMQEPAYGFKGSYDIYSGKEVTWRQPFEASMDLPPGEYTALSKVTYQTCNDDICLLPRTERIPVVVHLQ